MPPKFVSPLNVVGNMWVPLGEYLEVHLLKVVGTSNTYWLTIPEMVMYHRKKVNMFTWSKSRRCTLTYMNYHRKTSFAVGRNHVLLKLWTLKKTCGPGCYVGFRWLTYVLAVLTYFLTSLFTYLRPCLLTYLLYSNFKNSLPFTVRIELIYM